MSLDLKVLFRSLPDSEWKGLTSRRSRTWSIYSRNGKLESVEESNSSGYRVEVFFQGAIAFGCTASATDLHRQYDAALAMAKLSAKHKLYDFNIDTIRPNNQGAWASQAELNFSKSDLKGLVDQCVESSAILKNVEQIQSSESDFVLEEVELEMINASGAHTCQRYLSVMSRVAATAVNSTESQTRSNGTLVAQENIFTDWEAQKETLRRIAEQAKELLLAPDCPAQSTDLILAPDQLYLQIHESIGHPLEMDRILGDERNYAGWSFINPQDFGHLQFGSPLLNVTFDPTVETELASYGFDESGAKAEKEYLIKDGLLLRSLGSIESQVRSGVPGVANYRSASWNRAPIDRMANINMEPGNFSLQQLIEQVDDGIFMQTNRSWSIDDYRNKFQFGCEYGQWIKGGKIVGVVKNPNYRGKCLDFWRSLIHVGDRSTYDICGSFYCGKGEPNQVIRVGHATPHALFRNIDVFGGA